MTTAIPQSLTGPETEVRDAYLSMRAAIHNSPGVVAVLALSIIPTECKWLYLVRTCYATWPKFVVGRTNEDMTDVEIIFRGQLESEAVREFDGQNYGEHQ